MRVLIIRDRFNHFWHCGAAGAALRARRSRSRFPGVSPTTPLGVSRPEARQIDEFGHIVKLTT